MFETETVPCALCGGEESDAVFTGYDRLLGFPDQFHVVRCKRCGLTYTNPRPTQAALARFYPDDYGVFDPTPWQRRRMTLYHRRIARRLRRAVGGGQHVSILDVGCGSGDLLAQCSRFGWKCAGIEMNAAAAEKGSVRHGLDIQVGTDTSVQLLDVSFDIIVLSHVLEHVLDPNATLDRMRNAMAPNGKLFITLPNCDSWERRRFGSDWYPWDTPRHLYHFTPETLSQMLNRAGFEIAQMRYLTGFYVPQSMRYRRSASIASAATPTARSSSVVKECIKTAGYAGLLATSAIGGRLIRGEVMEVFAAQNAAD